MSIIHPADSLSYPIGQSRSVAYHEGAKAREKVSHLSPYLRQWPEGNPYEKSTIEWEDFNLGWAAENTYLERHK